MKNARRTLAAGVGVSVVLALALAPAAFAEDTEHAATAAELIAAVAAAPSGQTTTVVLDPAFEAISVTASLAVPAGADVIVAGADPDAPVALATGPGLSGKHFAVSGGAGASLTLKNLDFLGANTVTPAGERVGNDGGGGVAASALALTIDNTQFAGIARGSALSIGFEVRELTITDSSFRGNSAGAGGAISLNPDTGPVVIDASTFVHNEGTGIGYPGGAIASKDGRQPVTVSKSLFRANSSVHRGGAISLDYYGGEFTVSDSIFDANIVTAAGEGKSTSDGGAIAVTARLGAPAHTSISSSTFTNNLSQDEGGAILIQTGPEARTSVINSTFTGNIARGMQATYDDTSGGGAIEFFGTTATVAFSTFALNVAERGKLMIGVSQRGAAVSSYGSGTDWPAQPLTLGHNVFVDNYVTKSDGTPDLNNRWAHVYASGGVAAPPEPEESVGELRGVMESNVGVDAGVVVDRSIVNSPAVFGVDTPAVSDNRSPVRAGDPRWSGDAAAKGYATPGTIPLLPRDGDLVSGLADGIAASEGFATVDARGFPQDAPLADAGATQSAWLRFDANGGSWSGLTAGPFDGTRYVDPASPALNVWGVAPIGLDIPFESAPTEAPSAGLEFQGWNTAADGSGTAYPADAGALASTAGNRVLYAQWRSPAPAQGTVVVLHESEDGETLRPRVTLTGTIGEPYMTEEEEIPGWTLAVPPLNIAGYFAEEQVTVTYIYRKDAEPTPTPTPSPSDTAEPTQTPTPSPTATAGPTPSPSPTCPWSTETPAPSPSPTDGEGGVIPPGPQPTEGPCAPLPGTGASSPAWALGIAGIAILLGLGGLYTRRRLG